MTGMETQVDGWIAGWKETSPKEKRAHFPDLEEMSRLVMPLITSKVDPVEVDDAFRRIINALSELRGKLVLTARNGKSPATDWENGTEGGSDSRPWVSRLCGNIHALVASAWCTYIFQTLSQRIDQDRPAESAESALAQLAGVVWMVQEQMHSYGPARQFVKAERPAKQSSLPLDIWDLRDQLGIHPAPIPAIYWAKWWATETGRAVTTCATASDERSARGNALANKSTQNLGNPLIGADGPKCRYFSVPIAMVFPSENSRARICDLVFEGVPGNQQLFDHPESALVPLNDAWLNTMTEAARYLGQEQDASVRIAARDAISREHRYFAGDSHGGAAIRACRNLGEGTYPDPGVVVLACIQGEITGGNKMLGPVGGISEKVAAALEEEDTDTICVVDDELHPDLRETNNAVEALKVLRSHSRRSSVHLEILERKRTDLHCPHCAP